MLLGMWVQDLLCFNLIRSNSIWKVKVMFQAIGWQPSHGENGGVGKKKCSKQLIIIIIIIMFIFTI